MSAVGLTLAALRFDGPPFGWPGSLLVALSVVAALLAYTLGSRWRRQPSPTRFVLLALRLGAIVCLLITLLHPVWTAQHEVDELPIVAVVLDDSASMAQPLGPRDVTRYDEAVNLLQEQLQPALAGSHRVRLYDIAAHALSPDALPDTAAGKASPLTDTLLRVQRDLHAEPLVGIALLSDGAEVTARPALGELAELRVPVYGIDVADAAAPAAAATDLSVQAVYANRHALLGNTVTANVDLAAAGELAAVPVQVSLLDGDRQVAARAIQWVPGARTTRVELEFVPRRVGEFVYTVAVAGPPDESELSNNRTTFPLAVRAEPLRVLYVDGVLRWEGKFIREALATDPDLNVVATVRTVRAGADQGSPGLLLPEQLANFDVVIIGDVEAAYFSSSAELAALRTWITDEGGGLLLTGGYHSFGPNGFGGTSLREVLPVVFSGSANPQIEQPFNIKLTTAGRAHAVFRLTGDPIRDTAFFHKLPALDGCSRIAGVKPGAAVLAVNPRISGPYEQQGLPVMVAQQVGAGRTMVFAVDTTWRWRMVVGGFAGDSSFYEQFWGQLVRWLAGEETEVPQRLFASTDRARYHLGETIELRVKLSGTGGDSKPGADDSGAWRVVAQACYADGPALNVPLAELGDGAYRGTLAAGRPGRCDLTVRATPASSLDAAVAQLAYSRVVTVDVARPDLETRDPRPDPAWLAQATQRTGGRLLKPDEVAAWARQLPADPVLRTITRTSGAWGDVFCGSAFVLLLCAEWIVRRWSQLP